MDFILENFGDVILNSKPIDPVREKPNFIVGKSMFKIDRGLVS